MLKHIKNVHSAIENLRNKKMIILTDHADRENEGDLIFPAEIITADIINFMIKNGSGIVCLSLLKKQLQKLNLDFMVPPHENCSQRGTPFTVSIEAKDGVTTGVSAQDRATTILTAINENVSANDIVKPGHVFPLQAKEGGVLARQGHTEGSIDIVQLAGFSAAAVLCEVMNADGTMAKGKQLEAFARQHDLFMLSIDDLIAYRRSQENLIIDEVSTEITLNKYGKFALNVIKEKMNEKEHVVLINRRKNFQLPTLVRIHSTCLTGDLFGSQRCDCHQQLHYSLNEISKRGGLLIYLNQEGRGIGLFNKIKSYSLQDQGMDTVEANQHLGFSADPREYYMAANILRNHKIFDVILLTNNPHKVKGLLDYGIEKVTMENLPIFTNEQNKLYLKTKKEKLNHLIPQL